MKYLILIWSNPQPWGHPTGDYVAENLALPHDQRAKMNADFDALLSELSANGELVGGEALSDPASSSVYRWRDGDPVQTDGPYAETKEHLAGFFAINVESRERADQIAAQFAGPGETIELRPAMVFGPDEG